MDLVIVFNVLPFSRLVLGKVAIWIKDIDCSVFEVFYDLPRYSKVSFFL